MKHLQTILLCAALLLTLAGCGAKQTDATHAASKEDMIAEIAKTALDVSSEAGTSATEMINLAPPDPAMQDGALDLEPLPESDVDVDLTKMNSTMVYARVLNLMTNPDTYVGMTVRMEGALALYEDPESHVQYFACIIADATACCAQGIEFQRKGDFRYPEDYPALDSEVVVEGVFEIYEEDGLRYIRLGDATMVPKASSTPSNG